MCLFLQNQDFQKHTETVLNLLSTGARQAAEHITSLNSDMSRQLRALGDMDRSLEGLQQGQHRVAVQVDRQVEGLQQLQSQALSLDEKLAVVVRLEVRTCPSLLM